MEAVDLEKMVPDVKESLEDVKESLESEADQIPEAHERFSKKTDETYPTAYQVQTVDEDQREAAWYQTAT